MQYSDPDLTLLVNSIVTRFINAFVGNTNLISIFTIGSMSNSKYVARKNNDFDLRLLIRDPSVDFIDQMKSISAQCVDELQGKTRFQLSWTDVIGPARYVQGNQSTFLLHIIALTPESLDSLPTMHRISYSKSYIIHHGMDCLTGYKHLKLTAEGVLNEIEGIRYCLACLNNKTQTQQIWQRINSEYRLVSQTVPFTINVGYEFLRYSLSKCFCNSLSLATQNKNTELYNRILKLRQENQSLLESQFDSYSSTPDFFCAEGVRVLSLLDTIISAYK